MAIHARFTAFAATRKKTTKRPQHEPGFLHVLLPQRGTTAVHSNFIPADFPLGFHLTDFSFGNSFKLLDHVQRNTLHIGGQSILPWRSYASTDVYYASGFSNGDPSVPDKPLQPHTTFDLALGKNFGDNFP
jgi:hypothetical protein